MPSKGTPHRKFRCDDALWDAARAKAGKQGRDVSAIIRQLLNTWVTEGDGEG